jgi:hypothetical protein
MSLAKVFWRTNLMLFDAKDRPLITWHLRAKLVFFVLSLGMLSVPSAGAETYSKQSLKERLAHFITTSPDVVQFAKDRKFEEAWIIRSSKPRPSSEECRKYLQKERFELLILEYVWNSEDDDRRFVLTLLQDKHVKMRDPEELLKTSLDLF